MIRFINKVKVAGREYQPGEIGTFDDLATESDLVASCDAESIDAESIDAESIGKLPQLIGQLCAPVTRTSNNSTDTEETILGSVSLPGGTMGPNSKLVMSIQWNVLPTDNTKTVAIDFGGARVREINLSGTTSNLKALIEIQNQNSLSSQSPFSYDAPAEPRIRTSIDTAAEVTIDFKCRWSANNTGEDAATITLGGYSIWHYESAMIVLPGSTEEPLPIDLKFFGMHIKETADDNVPDVRFGTVRSHDMKDLTGMWKSIEPAEPDADGHHYVWADLEKWVKVHSAAGRDLVFVLFGTPQWASARKTEPSAYGQGNAAEPLDMANWEAFCTAVATRFRNEIKYYEVWNEPNYFNDGTGIMRKDYYEGPVNPTLSTKCFFSGTFAKLAEMVWRANKAIKAANPDAKIICPAVQGWTATPGKSDDYFNGMMSAPTGDPDPNFNTMGKCVDIIGVHLYLPEGNNVLALPKMINCINAAKAASDVSDKPTWDTESAPIGPNLKQIYDDCINKHKDDDPDWDPKLCEILCGDLIELMLKRMVAKGIKRTMYYQYDNESMGFKGRTVIEAAWEKMVHNLTGT